MYESFFALSQRPFAAAPSAKRYFPAAAIEAARQSLSRCIDRAEGIGLLIGPAGTGKSTLCQVLAAQFSSNLEVAQLSSGQFCTRRALLQAILFELGLPYRAVEEGELRLSLIDHLSPRGTANETEPTKGLLLVVDEAHTVPLRLLEELRLITNLVRSGVARVRLILAGGPQLEERFASPKLESFNQRVAARCYLESFDRQQTADYVRHQILQANGNPDQIFTPDALGSIYAATDGIPRLVNQVCDHALLLAYAGGIRQLTAAGIDEAWSDLQQLPMPWNASKGSPAKPQAAGVVEFGTFDEQTAEELPAAVPFRAISADSQEPLDSATSARDLERAIAARSDSDDDFQPAGSIGPEIELVFSSSSNPFHESFDEEEIVIDRYSTLESETFADRPLVRSSDSRELAALLSAAAAIARPTPSIYSPIPSAEISEIGKPATAIAAATWPGGMPDQPPAADESDDKLWSSTKDRSSREPSRQEQENPNLPPTQPRPNPADAGSDSDADLIVIEESPDRVVPAPKKPAARAHRKEYRQLFAQLRRG